MSEENDDIIETRLVAGSRLALQNSDWLSDWYVGVSPRNGYGAMAEGKEIEKPKPISVRRFKVGDKVFLITVEQLISPKE